MPRLVACGGRGSAYERFRTRHGKATEGDFVALLIDSEEPIYNIDETWTHLREQDGWEKPNGAEDNQVLRMTTSMETWLIADQEVLAKHFGPGFRKSGRPMLGLEQRSRREVLKALEEASKNCPAPYKKGAMSFEVLGKLTPPVLQKLLPSFQRVLTILELKLRIGAAALELSFGAYGHSKWANRVPYN